MVATSKSCDFLINRECLLGYHGGRPHAGNCRACIAAGENQKNAAKRLIKPPPLTTLARNIAVAAIAEGKALASKVPSVDESEQVRRLEICRGCEQFIAASSRCAKCGCFMKFKSRLRSAHCPVGKW